MRLAAPFRRQVKQCTLPQHNPKTTCSSSGTPSRLQLLHLLACMHAGRFRKMLHQDRIETVMNDRELFCFLRQQYARNCGRMRAFLSLKTVQGIFFTKFRLPVGGAVEVRHHNPCCTSSACECIPPESRVEPSPQAEYRCKPGPPAVWPPIDPNYLSHLFRSPCHANEDDTWVLDLLPRRICGKLHGQAGKPAEGWGIYYQEGLDWDAIAVVVFVVFLAGSLLFGVLWSRFKMDVQGAFGVSAYMVTACGMLLSLVATRADKM